MKFIKSTLLILSLSASQSVWAGMPIDKEVSCAIGGEKFKTTSTMSCTTFGQTMSMQPITSCEFVTKLPQCPGNKLPMYKEFSEAELLEIEKIMHTEAYKDAATKSRYFLAATIEQSLSSPDVVEIFSLLQQGLWYTPKQSYEDSDYMRAYHKSAKAAFAQEDYESKPFWRGAQAMVFIGEGNLTAARNNIKLMKTDNAESKDYLKSYKRALTYCLKNPTDDKLCQPTTSLREHTDKNSTQ